MREMMNEFLTYDLEVIEINNDENNTIFNHWISSANN